MQNTVTADSQSFVFSYKFIYVYISYYGEMPNSKLLFGVLPRTKEKTSVHQCHVIYYNFCLQDKHMTI